MIKAKIENSTPSVATFFLDHELHILHYSPQLPEFLQPDNSEDIIPLTPKKIIYNQLIEDAKLTLRDYQPRQKELTDIAGNEYLAILLPYHELDQKTGVIVSLTNITEQKRLERNLLQKDERQTFLMNLSDAIRNMESDLFIQKKACTMLGNYLEADFVFFSKISGKAKVPVINSGFSRNGYGDLQKNEKFYRFILAESSLDAGIPLIINDFGKNHSFTKDISNECIENNIRASLIIPLLKNKRLEWTFNVFYSSNHTWMKDEIALISEVAERVLLESERARAEKNVKKARKYAESIVETLHEPLLVLTPDLKVKSANQAFYDHFKVNPDETEGSLIYELGNRQWDIPILRKLLEDVLPENNVFTDFEVSHNFEKIGTRTMLVNARRLDHVQLILLGIRDITDQKKWEQDIQLAKSEAERAIRIKEDFLAHMSHEIRTPLNTVVGLAHLLLEQPHNEQQQKNLNVLKTAAINLNHLVDNIFDFGRIQAGESKPEPKEISIRNFIEGIIKVHQPVANSKGIKLKYHISRNVPQRTVTEPSKLMQILNNLLGNALKFTNKGSVNLDIQLFEQDKTKAILEFSIIDTGIGIEPKQVETIFNEFYQVDSSTLKKYGGTGLGLAITRLYLKMMNSEIKVESNFGGGSRFWFRLPVKVEKQTLQNEATTFQILEEPDLSKTSILIVEDDDFSRIMLKQLLMIWGIKHDEAVNGQEAVEMASKNNYDIILMDVHMPVMDGYKATRIIREMPQYAQKPIVALSADVSQRVKDEVKSGLFTANRVKPIVPDLLLEFISELVYAYHNVKK